MSYRHDWSKTFRADAFNFFETPVTPLGSPPEPCPDHEPYCIRCRGLEWHSGEGVTTLINLIDILTEMPGIKQKILTLGVDAMLTDMWGYYSTYNEIRLVVDGAVVWGYKKIFHYHNKWHKGNRFAPNINVEGKHTIDVQDRMGAVGYIGWCTLHNALIKLDAEYYSDVKPETATVRLTVIDSKSGALVKGAYVALMSGVRIVADGYTDGGEVIFENINEGSYTVKVLAGGYYAFEQSIKVEPPSVWYEIKIVPIPTIPMPSWVWYAVAGIGGLGAIAIIPSVIKRKEKPPIIVVK